MQETITSSGLLEQACPASDFHQPSITMIQAFVGPLSDCWNRAHTQKQALQSAALILPSAVSHGLLKLSISQKAPCLPH